MTFTLMSIIEDAYDSIGRREDTLSSADLASARRSLETLFAQWANDDVNIWKIAEDTTATVASTASYSMGSSGTPIVDVLNVSIRTSDGFDTTLEPISQADYQLLPNKTQTGKPTQYTTFRTTTGVTLKLYPVPNAVYTLTYHTVNYVTPPSTYDGTVDLPRKFKPALVYGLAYLLSMKNKMEAGPDGTVTKAGTSPADRQELSRLYLDFYTKAKDADREKAPFIAVPFVR